MLVALQTFFLALLLKNVHTGGGSTSRSKRWLLTPIGTQVGVFTTISTPLENMPGVSFAYFFEANYYTMANSSFLGPLFGEDTLLLTVRRRRDAGSTVDEIPDSPESDDTISKGTTRALIYHSLEKTLERGGLNGRACLLRAICENSMDHFHHNGILGDLLHIILTPSSSESEDEIADEFYLAEVLGRSEAGCDAYSYRCPLSVLEHISLPFI